MKKNKKNQILSVSVIALLVSWLIYFYKFLEVYSWADFFTNSSGTALAKLVYVFSYYGDLLLPYVVLGFLLLNLNLLLTLVLIFLGSKEKKFDQTLLIMSVSAFVIATCMFLYTSIWPLMLILVLVSLIIAYTLYTVYNKTYSEDLVIYEENELIKEAGPFNEEAEAEQFFKEFCEQWQTSFERQDLVLVPKVSHDEEKNYYLNIHVEYK